MKKTNDRRYRFWYVCYDKGIKDPEKFICDMYLSGKSSIEIAEYFLKEKEITVSSKNIQNYIKRNGITRTKAEAKKLAIKTGRMIYRKKPEHEKYHVKYISAGLRLKLLQEADYKCKYCGNGRHNGYSIELHHKNGPESTEENLDVICFLCHRGLHENKKKEENNL